MNIWKHCELCENRLLSLSTGTICGLTNKKPDFSGKCTTINFGSNHIDLIKEVNIDYQKVLSTKTLTYLNFIVFIFIGVSVMYGGYFLGSSTWEKGLISTVPLIIMGVGFSIIPLATGPLFKYRRDIKIVKSKKKNLDDLLAFYNIQYESKLIIDEDVHGNKEYEVKINFLRYHTK